MTYLSSSTNTLKLYFHGGFQRTTRELIILNDYSPRMQVEISFNETSLYPCVLFFPIFLLYH